MSLTRNLSDKVRERGSENVCEGDSAHLSVCESSLSSVATVHRQGTWNLAATVIGNVLWGQSVLRKKKKKRGDTWSLRANVELFWGTCHVYCSLSKFLEGFLKSMLGARPIQKTSGTLRACVGARISSQVHSFLCMCFVPWGKAYCESM